MPFIDKIPKSLFLFLVTGIVYALQLFPLTGVFLMFVAAPFWSVITINLGFIFMIYEAYTRKTWRWLIIFPCLYFGIYAFFTIDGHIKLYQLQKTIESENNVAKIPFNPQQNDLVVSWDKRNSRVPVDHLADDLIKTYDLPVIYQNDGSGMGNTSVRIALTSACNASTLYKPAFDGFYERTTFGPNETNKLISELCFLRAKENPAHPVSIINSMNNVKIQDSILPTEMLSLTITDANGKAHTYKAGTATPLSWVPMPIAGCALNDAGASWNCVIQFWRSEAPVGSDVYPSGDFRYDSLPIASTLIGNALGLKHITASARIVQLKSDLH